MYRTSNIVAVISLEDYIRDYRNADKFAVYCKECSRYRTCWACPPFDFDIGIELSRYKTAWIIGTKIDIDDSVIETHKGWDLCTPVTYRIIEEVRRTLDAKLLNLEKEHAGSRTFFAGTCHLCPPDKCARIKEKPCIFPDRVRPSLESFGFDLGKTSLELLKLEMKWSRDGILPPYFVLVSGLFTINNEQLTIYNEAFRLIAYS
jgi:predicted metal-binding protein